MTISWFCQWDCAQDEKPKIDQHDHQGLLALLRGCPRLIEGHIMTPVQAHDPHYAAELHNSPVLVLQLEFAQIADLEHCLRPHGRLQALAHPDTLPSLEKSSPSHQAMLTKTRSLISNKLLKNWLCFFSMSRDPTRSCKHGCNPRFRA